MDHAPQRHGVGNEQTATKPFHTQHVERVEELLRLINEVLRGLAPSSEGLPDPWTWHVPAEAGGVRLVAWWGNDLLLDRRLT